jgi:hypothetical protein
MLDQNTAIISGSGTAFISRPQVIQAVLIEAAQTTKAHGFRYFAIVSADDTTQHSTLYMPGQTYTSGTLTGTATSFGNTTNLGGTYTGYTTGTPGSLVPISRPGAEIAVKMYREGEIDPGAQGIWDADSILAAAPSQ